MTRNYHGHSGEIDLIMQEGQTLIFIEVRFRKNDFYGGALESVTTQKQQRIMRTAEQYLQHETKLKNGRIDVVAMSQQPKNGQGVEVEAEYSFKWIKNAF